MSSFETYSYSALPHSRSIRLLEIIGVSAAAEITCALHVQELGSCDAYQALSYTWGAPIQPEVIDSPRKENQELQKFVVCEGRKLEVTPNLHDALLQISASVKRTLFWVDAICIDQQNLQERSVQVNIMGDIYENAERVIVWLGNDDEDTSTVSNLLKALSSAASMTQDSLGRLHVDDDNILDKIGLRSERDYEALVPFFRRSWFERAWIVQEVALAREIVVLCGQFELSWEDLGPACAYLMRGVIAKGLQTMRYTDQINESATFLAFARYACRQGTRIFDAIENEIGTAYRSLGATNNIYSLFGWLLFRLRRSKATEAKDRVFSLLGLMAKISREAGGEGIDVYPDYMMTTAEIYTSASRSIITRGWGLGLLAAVEDKSLRVTSDLPSWVPDFATRWGYPLILLGHPAEGPFYEAAGKFTNVPCHSPVHGRLPLTGTNIGTIVECGDTAWEIFAHQRFNRSAKLACHLSEVYFTGEPWVEALWRALIADRAGNQHPAPAKLATGFVEFFKFTICSNLRLANRGHYGNETFIDLTDDMRILAEKDSTGLLPKVPDVLREQFGQSHHQNILIEQTDTFTRECPQDSRPFLAEMVQSTVHRRLFRTNKNFIGLGPESMLQGDSVWVICGARTPFVLRSTPTNAQYELFGEAYLHGFMHGKAFHSPDAIIEQIELI